MQQKDIPGVAPVERIAGKAIKSTCQSCQQFTFDQVTHAKHTAVGLGFCKLDRSTFKLRPLGYYCAKYDATATRKAAIAALRESEHATAK